MRHYEGEEKVHVEDSCIGEKMLLFQRGLCPKALKGILLTLS